MGEYGGEEIKTIFSPCHIHTMLFIHRMNLQLLAASSYAPFVVCLDIQAIQTRPLNASPRSYEQNGIENPLQHINCKGNLTLIEIASEKGWRAIAASFFFS